MRSTTTGMSEWPTTRSEILTEVEAMIFARLFGRGRWLADRETAAILGRKLEQMALEERVPGDMGLAGSQRGEA